MVPPELSYPATARSEKLNTSKTQEINHKTDFMKRIEVLEEEVKKKKYLKEIKEKNKQKLDNINKSLRESQEKRKTDEEKLVKT